VSWIARGTPRPSQIRWRLLPSLARSVGLGPVCCPQKLTAANCYLPLLGTNRSFRSVPASPARRNGSAAKALPPANHAVAASRSCLSHIPVPVAASPNLHRFLFLGFLCRATSLPGVCGEDPENAATSRVAAPQNRSTCGLPCLSRPLDRGGQAHCLCTTQG
jgi:hypothetical protein